MKTFYRLPRFELLEEKMMKAADLAAYVERQGSELTPAASADVIFNCESSHDQQESDFGDGSGSESRTNARDSESINEVQINGTVHSNDDEADDSDDDDTDDETDDSDDDESAESDDDDDMDDADDDQTDDEDMDDLDDDESDESDDDDADDDGDEIDESDDSDDEETDDSDDDEADDSDDDETDDSDDDESDNSDDDSDDDETDESDDDESDDSDDENDDSNNKEMSASSILAETRENSIRAMALAEFSGLPLETPDSFVAAAPARIQNNAVWVTPINTHLLDAVYSSADLRLDLQASTGTFATDATNSNSDDTDAVLEDLSEMLLNYGTGVPSEG